MQLHQLAWMSSAKITPYLLGESCLSHLEGEVRSGGWWLRDLHIQLINCVLHE
jgi:hypothetical protein